jgi:hypothetical protein
MPRTTSTGRSQKRCSSPHSVRTGKEGVKAAETVKERKKERKKETKKAKRDKREGSGKREGKSGEEDDIDRRYEDLLQKELSELKAR